MAANRESDARVSRCGGARRRSSQRRAPSCRHSRPGERRARRNLTPFSGSYPGDGSLAQFMDRGEVPAMTAFLRTVAIAIALVAFIDPAIAVERSMPIRVALHLDEHDPDAVDVRSRLQPLLGDDVNVNGGDEAAAVIVIGHSAEPEVFGGAAPVSTVALTSAPNVSIVEAPASITLRSGQAADLRL